MRKIVAGLLMSLDGVVEAPNEWGWPRYMNAEMTDEITAGVAQADAVLLGRRTYLEFAEMWPRQGSDVPMADFLNNSPKYVVSATLGPALSWANSTILTGDLGEKLRTLKELPGRDILVPGSPTLVRALVADGLLDELHLDICPLVVGSGLHLFGETTHNVPFRLVASRTLTTGVLSVTYQRIRGDGEATTPPAAFPDAAPR